MNAPNWLRAIPRRERLEPRDDLQPVPRPIVQYPPSAPLGLVFRRLARWMAAGLRFRLAILGDRLRGTSTVQSRAVRLREVLLSMGGTAIKIGQQMSIRLDMLPPEYCEELSMLLHRTPPFPFEQARERIERAARRPIAEAYRSIDPEPIGSASIAVVYRGVRADGRQVAIKVRRPGIQDSFNADLTALDWLLTLVEGLTIVRPGYVRNLKTDLRSMLMEEIDFATEARYQTLFRKIVERQRVTFLSAPEVHHDLSSDDVLVSEFIEGIPCTRVLRAVESGDPAEAAWLASLDLDPKVLSERMVEACFWGLYEAPFFHGDPHPANILFQSGNRIVFVDFGACASTSERMRRIWYEMYERMLRDDAAGAAHMQLQFLVPLPYIDHRDLARTLEEAIWRRLLDIADKRTPWWERTTASVWLEFFRVLREYKLPATLDTVRALRASLLYDTIAVRLWHDLDMGMYRRYLRKAGRRHDRHARREFRKARRHRELLGQAQEAVDLVGRARVFVETVAESFPKEFQSLTTKSSFALVVALRILLSIVLLAGVLVGARMIQENAPATPGAIAAVARTVLSHRAFHVPALFLALIGVRRVLRRLSGVDPGRRYRAGA